MFPRIAQGRYPLDPLVLGGLGRDLAFDRLLRSLPVPRRGLCGDVFLVSTPRGPRVGGEARIETSVGRGEISLDVRIDIRTTSPTCSPAIFTASASGFSR